MATEDGAQRSSFNKYALACAIVASIISIIFGYDTGVMSGAMIFLKEDLKVNDVQVEILAGILNFCALFGSLLAGTTSDYIGRRYTIMVASTIFLIGSILMGYSPNYTVLITGRCIAGIGVGFALMIAPVYSAEISSPLHRGSLTCLPDLCISVGILLGYVSNYFFGKLTLKLGWRMMLGIAALPSLVLAFGILKLPESPRWLILKGRLGEARRVLTLVCNTEEEVESRFHDIKSAAGIDPDCTMEVVKPPTATNGLSTWKEIVIKPKPTVRWIVIAAVGLHFFVHAVGTEAVILYSPRILKKAGITNRNKLLLATVGLGLVKTVFIFVAAIFLDKFGRRRLLLSSLSGIILALACLGFGLTIIERSGGQVLWALILCITSTYAFMAFFSMGLGPVSWVYSAEIFPLKLRAQGASLGVAVNRLTNAAISMSFISIYTAITIGGSMFMFAGISVLAWLFVFFLLPETRERTLEEIEVLFSRSKKSRNEGIEIHPHTNI